MNKLVDSNRDFNLPLGTYVKSHVKTVLESMAGDMNECMIAPIHPDVNIYYNSVNVIVGKQSLGKTVIAIEEIIKLAVLDTHHMLVYVTKNGDESDRTFKALKQLILMPIVVISEKQAKEYIEMLIAYKNLYYEIKEQHLEDEILEEQKEQMFNYLHINDFNRKFLHTLVLFDDISNSPLFNNESGFFPLTIKKCRHTNISYFLLIQGWKGLKPFVKNEITTLFIFPCYNKQQLRYIYSQSASNLDFDDFYKMYSEMVRYKNINPDSHPYMVVQVISGGDTSVEF